MDNRDLSLGDWGPYSKHYAEISHILPGNEAAMADFVPLVGFDRGRVIVPDINFDCGYHVADASVDLGYIRYRFDLQWKETEYCDAEFFRHEHGSLCCLTFVNNSQNPKTYIASMAAVFRPFNRIVLDAPLPLHVYLLDEIYRRTGDRELLRHFFERAAIYCSYFAGRHPLSRYTGSTTGLLTAYSDSYNTLGIDDYPVQHFEGGHGLYHRIATVATTAHTIRTAKILRNLAGLIDADTDIFDTAVDGLAAGLQKYAWDGETGWFEHVYADKGKRLKHPDGGSFNMGIFNMGIDGASPLVAGVCTPERQSMDTASMVFLEGDDHRRTFRACRENRRNRTMAFPPFSGRNAQQLRAVRLPYRQGRRLPSVWRSERTSGCISQRLLPARQLSARVRYGSRQNRKTGGKAIPRSILLRSPRGESIKALAVPEKTAVSGSTAILLNPKTAYLNWT